MPEEEKNLNKIDTGSLAQGEDGSDMSRPSPYPLLERMLGRTVTQEEIARYDRIAKETQWDSDDALWHVLYIYEFENDRLRKQIAEVDKVAESAILRVDEGIKKTVRRVMEDMSKSMVDSFQKELQENTERLRNSSERHNTWANLRLWGVLLAGLSVFFAIVFSAGYVMGAGKVPFWFRPGNGLEWFCSLFFLAPSGWIFFLGSLPYAAYTLKDSFCSLSKNFSAIFAEGASSVSLSAIGALVFAVFKIAAAAFVFVFAGMFFLIF